MKCRRDFGRIKVPDRRTIERFVTNFWETGSVANANKGHSQWCNEVRWSPGQEASLVPTCSNLRSFGRKCTALKKVLYL